MIKRSQETYIYCKPGRHYCTVCKAWLADNKITLQIHMSGKRHQENVKENLKQQLLEKDRHIKEAAAANAIIEPLLPALAAPPIFTLPARSGEARKNIKKKSKERPFTNSSYEKKKIVMIGLPKCDNYLLFSLYCITE